MFHARVWTDHASATTVALAAFLSCRDVQFVDFDRGFEAEPRRVQRSQEVLDAPVH